MDDEGYLSADAIVALLVVTFGLIIVLQAQAMALNLGRRAAESRLATAGALWVLETQWPRMGHPGRQTARDLTWRLEAENVPVQQSGPLLCRVNIWFGRAPLPAKPTLSTIKLCGASA